MEDLAKKLFGSSGIRGLTNGDLTPILATQLGLAITTFSKAKAAVVARDTRNSGLMLENALVSGLTSGGATVKQLGILPTPVLAFLTCKMNADVGIMVTASHNPPQYNGIKIFNHDSTAYDERSQGQIEKIIECKRFSLADWQKIGKAHFADETRLYTSTIMESVKLRKKWRVIVDPGCGATHDLAPRILGRLGCKVTTLNSQPDGFFPARSPEPNEESLKPLAKTVGELGADAGVAYDGDGDRVTFIDEKGALADFDRVLAAYAAHITKKKGGGTVVTNVEASMCIERMVELCGGKVLRTKVGDVYLSQATSKKNAIFAGEPCGAWIHPEFHFCPDGILSSVLLLKALDDEGKKLTELVSETPNYPILRRSITCTNETKFKVVKKIREEVGAFPKRTGISRVDGLRVSLDEGWILIRASGTEPLVRLTVEGESLKAATKIMEKGAALVEHFVRKVN